MSGRVTLAAIAARVGCSKNTVSLALHGDPQIPPHTRDRIRGVAKEMGYKPNAIISQLMSQLRAERPVRFQAKLALANASPAPATSQQYPAVAASVRGCMARAAALGY